jgi:hypothetical protein
MKKIFIIVFLVLVIVNYGYSSEEDVFYNFFRNVNDEMQRTRELCITYYAGVYNDDDLKIIENDMKIHLSNVSLIIRENIKLIESNILLIRIFTIIDYEINNLFNIKYLNNSYEVIGKIDLLLEMMMLAYIINYYEPITSSYNL